ncbi:MAG TPA: PQQ-dependent sugar dehydrogenase [Gemmatimonadaceae bacterium]|nr:PQQ-dependent sugar dehydrogenase [Gemmatimonadaceae bacterium]
MKTVLSLTGLVLLASCATSARTDVAVQPQGSAAVVRTAEHDFRIVTVAEGLVNPWSMAFLPGGDMLVTERPGRLRIIRNGKLLPDPVSGLPKLRVGGQGGLLDVVPHPDFATNHLIYFSYAKPSADTLQGTTAVARARFENDCLNDVQEIFEAKVWSTGRGHHGSRLAFDRQGYLYITLGDRQVPPAGNLEAHPAQDLTNHFGKTIRLHDDGRVPADNPFVNRTDARPEIWTYGHRNMQGLVIHPVTGDVFTTEHGPQGGDELNFIQPGRNYGWPVIGFGVNYRTGAAIHSGTHRDGMEQPIHVWVPSIGTSGLMIYTGDRFPQWKGNFFAGGMAGEQLVRLTVDGRRVVSTELVVQRKGRIRDVRQGPDGLIYLAIEDREGKPTPIVRLEPVARTS